MTILFASGNLHKKEELQSLFPKEKLILPKELGVDFFCSEEGSDYFQNSYQKAMTLWGKSPYPILADDSGLSVEALEGAPGIYSARYGATENKENLSDNEKMDLVLKQMKGIENRKAFFVCNLVFLFSPYRFYNIQETVEGEIAKEKRGKEGFGYDPIFYLPSYGKTMAELSATEKNTLSHRAKAAMKLQFLLKQEHIG